MGDSRSLHERLWHRLSRSNPAWFLLFAPPALAIFWLLSWSIVTIPGNNHWAEVAAVSQVLLGTVGVVIAIAALLQGAISLRLAAESQRKAMYFQAWQTISAAQGRSGSGGRRAALEELHRNGESLIGVDLSGGAYLAGLDLPGADLTEANLKGAVLWGVNFEEANLKGASFENATFGDLEADILREAVVVVRESGVEPSEFITRYLSRKVFERPANLKRANLAGSNFKEAVLWGAQLQGSYMRDVILDRAELGLAELEGAHICGASLRSADLSLSRDLTREQILSARDWLDAKLPTELTDLELPADATEEDLDRLGRTWRPSRAPE
jgi:uncharacterized protein YjbI with pentapeptide repeats